MTQISLSKAYVILDEERGPRVSAFKQLKASIARDGGDDNDRVDYFLLKRELNLLNLLKRRFALVSDAEQIPLGL